jgi:hypothetical protein
MPSVNKGTAIIDFGALGGAGSNEASVFVPDATVLANSHVEAYVMADDTSVDHTADDHRYFAADVGLTCGTPTASSGFFAYGRSRQKLTGKYTLRWVRAD